MKKNILVIGTGSIASRHIQNILKIDESSTIDVLSESSHVDIDFEPIFYSTFKYLNNLKTLNMYLMLLVTQITIILFEKIISQLMFGFYFNLNDFLEIAIFSIILSYPVFYIFSKIDRVI